MSEKIAKFVAKEFDAGCASGLGSYGIYERQRISVIFKIDTLGRATEIRRELRISNLRSIKVY